MKKKSKVSKKKTAKTKKPVQLKKSVLKIPAKFKRFQELLATKREDILKITHKKETELAYADIGDEGDVASQTFEREMMFEVTDGERMILDNIEAALRKMEKGEFSICESCHKKISDQRLDAMPWARYCIQCQSRMEAPRV